MLKPVFQNPWVQAAAVIGGLALFCLVCYVLSPVLVPLLFAFLVAYVLEPVVHAFVRRGCPRNAAIAGLFVVAVLLVLLIPIFLVPDLVREADRLIHAASQGVGSGVVSDWIDGLVSRLPLDDLVRYLGWAPSGEEAINARALLAEHIGMYVKENAVQVLRNYAPQFADAGQWAGVTLAELLASIGHSIVSAVIFIGNFVLFAFVTAYLLRDFHGVVAGARELVPPRYRARVVDIVRRIDGQIRSFFRGQATVCACLGVMYMLGLSISGTPFGVLLGCVGGLASFVPYLGLALTILPALFLTALQHGADWHVLGVLATFGIAQSIEGTILTPRIVGREVGLNPVWVILAILVFGSLLGFLGLLLAVPIAAALKVLVLDAVAYYKRSPVFESSDASSEGAAAIVPPVAAAAGAVTERRPRTRSTKASPRPKST
jgi:predicted PurR-regulated permease PerM